MRFQFALLLVLLVLLGLSTSVRAGNDRTDISDVINTLNNYLQDLNVLAESGLGTSCILNASDAIRGNATGRALVEKYFSRDIRTYFVYKKTAPYPSLTVLNFTAGTPEYPTTLSLYNHLLYFYGVYMPTIFLARPYLWKLSAPTVTIVRRDANYDRATTAYVIADNESSGFGCNADKSRTFRIAQNEYQHTMIYDDDTQSWKFIVFGERMKNRYTVAPGTITQIYPDL